MPYSAPLDGIRAIAILAVLLFHISPGALRGGFTGVDVFFVLSGFLITSIILHDVREGSFSLREFYLRRVQRLLPNIVVTVLAVLLLWTIFMPPSSTAQAGRHGLWTIFNGSNIYIWKYLGGYWGEAAEWAPLTHTWSLGVEEQFYLLFPGSLLLLARFQPRRVRSCLVVAAILSYGLCLNRTHNHPESTFYLLPTRIWELLIGAALAAHRTPLHDDGTRPWPAFGVKTLESIGLAGFGMVIMGFFLIDDGSAFPGLVVLAPTIGTAFILVSVADGRTRFSQILSSPFLVGTGKLSYSLYLWHWPLIILGKNLADFYGKPQMFGSVAGGVLGILLAWGAYAGVEQPLRKRGPGRSWRFAAIVVGFSIVALGALGAASRQAVADPAHRFDTPVFSINLFNAGRAAGPNGAPAARYNDLLVPPPPPGLYDCWRTGGVVHLYGGGHPQVVVLGSSHALMYSRLIDDICREMGLSVSFLGTNGAPAFFAQPGTETSTALDVHEFDAARRKRLREWRPEVVFVIDRWDLRGGTAQGFEKDLRAFLAEVSPLAGRMLFVAQPPVVSLGERFNLREFVSWRMRKEKNLPRFYPDRNEPLRRRAIDAAEAAAADFPNLRVLRADLPFYREDGSIRYESGRAFFYADDDHLTDAGAEVVRRLFQNGIAEAHLNASAQTKSKALEVPH